MRKEKLPSVALGYRKTTPRVVSFANYLQLKPCGRCLGHITLVHGPLRRLLAALLIMTEESGCVEFKRYPPPANALCSLLVPTTDSILKSMSIPSRPLVRYLHSTLLRSLLKKVLLLRDLSNLVINTAWLESPITTGHLSRSGH